MVYFIYPFGSLTFVVVLVLLRVLKTGLQKQRTSSDIWSEQEGYAEEGVANYDSTSADTELLLHFIFVLIHKLMSQIIRCYADVSIKQAHINYGPFRRVTSRTTPTSKVRLLVCHTKDNSQALSNFPTEGMFATKQPWAHTEQAESWYMLTQDPWLRTQKWGRT